MKRVTALAESAVTVAAIAAIAVLGWHGITDPVMVGAIAGLGGYEIKSRANRTA